jgi:hypothetical protein
MHACVRGGTQGGTTHKLTGNTHKQTQRIRFVSFLSYCTLCVVSSRVVSVCRVYRTPHKKGLKKVLTF